MAKTARHSKDLRYCDTDECRTKQARAVRYGGNVMATVSRLSTHAKIIEHWANEFSSLLGLELNPSEEAEGTNEELEWRRPRRISKHPSLEVWKLLKEKLDVWGTTRPLDWGSFEEPIAYLCQNMGFNPADTSVLQVMLDYEDFNPVEELWDRLSNSEGFGKYRRLDIALISLLTGYNKGVISRCLGANGALRSSGLIRVDNNGAVQVLSRLQSLLRENPDAQADLRPALLGPIQTATLVLADFEHLGQDVKRVLAVLRGALAERAKGIVVILHGPPGTGKTELAKSLAATLNVPLHAIGETDESGNEPNRSERLSELQLAQRLLQTSEPAILLFDEAEDLFGNRLDFLGMLNQRHQAGSRAFLHRLLENGSAPLIMTANSLEAFGDAVLRRASCCLEVKVPPADVRTKLWAKAAAAEGVQVSKEELDRLGRQLPASPAVAAMAMQTARLGGGDPDTVNWAVTGVMAAMNSGKMPKPEASPDHYDPTLVSADINLNALADRLSAPNASRAVSLLLSGPSGTGKSAYARYLANRMGLPVLHKRGSDIFGKYVGENERNIAAAFSEATESNSFLIFDEADSLIADRRGAGRNWEVSQVNEMLTWMEQHRLPFCCTTNLIENMDSAAMRRFLVKAKFGYLSPDQVELAFRRILGCEPPREIRKLTQLTPADFDLVKRSAELEGTLGDPVALFLALEREQAAKPGVANQIGFLRTH